MARPAGPGAGPPAQRHEPRARPLNRGPTCGSSIKASGRSADRRPDTRQQFAPSMPCFAEKTLAERGPSIHVDRLHRRSTPAGRAWRHGPNGHKPRPLVLHNTSVFVDWAQATLAPRETGLPGSSFARPHELKDLYHHTPDGSGLLLARGPFGHVLLTVPVGDGGERGNLLVVGPPRRGKSHLLTGQILAWPYNLIVNDPKKELAKLTGTYRGLLGKALFFDPLSPTSAQYDPLRGRYTERQLSAAATQLLYKPNEGDAEIFTQRAIKLLTLLFLAGREENQQARYEKHHLLPYIREMMDLGGLNPIAARLHAVSPYLARLFLNEEYNSKTNYDEVKFLRDAYATMDARLWPMLSQDVVHCFNGSDFLPEDFIYSARPVTLYLCWSEAELLSLAPLVRLVWDSLINGMIHAYDNANGRPCYPALCLIDEAGRTEIPGWLIPLSPLRRGRHRDVVR